MLSDERKGQIALRVLKHQLQEKGIRLTPNFRREIGNEAKVIGIQIEEARQFMEEIIRELVDEAFKPRTSDNDPPGVSNGRRGDFKQKS